MSGIIAIIKKEFARFFMDRRMLLTTIIMPKMMKTPRKPFSIIGTESRNCPTSIFISIPSLIYATSGITIFRTIPPAITDAICPDTLTPIECISRKFCGSSCNPIL